MSRSHKKNPTNYWLGKKRSKKTRDKIQKAHIGRKLPQSQKDNISKALKGKMPKNIDKFIEARRKYKITDEHKKKISNALKGRFLGEKSNVWKGGQSRSYWKKICLKRDDYTCQTCEIKDKRVLTVDHIKSKALYPELQFDISNGITLCANCHAIKTFEDKELHKYMKNKIIEARK